MINALKFDVRFWAVVAWLALTRWRRSYTGRHRAARGQSTSQVKCRSASDVEAQRWLAELTVPLELVPVAELPAVAPKAGVGRYAHLRPEELDTTAERELRLAELGIIKPRSPWGTQEWADEWTEELAGVAT